MHTYRKIKDGHDRLFVVGYFDPCAAAAATGAAGASASPTLSYRWVDLQDFNTEAEAAAYASYLNGGAHPATTRGL
jgi:hypothetical protein